MHTAPTVLRRSIASSAKTVQTCCGGYSRILSWEHAETRKIKTIAGGLTPETLDQSEIFSAKTPPMANETNHPVSGQKVESL